MIHIQTMENEVAKARRQSQTRSALWVAVLSVTPLMAQSSLRISTPTDGTTFEPGQAVTVEVLARGAFQQVALGGDGGLGLLAAAQKPPYVFTFRLPAELRIGLYLLTAFGYEKPGNPIYSPQVAITVERREAPVRLQVDPPRLRLRLRPGEVGVLTVVATYKDGARLDIQDSTLLSFRQAPPGIVKITRGGVVSGVSTGTTKVTLTYRGLTVEVPVVVGEVEQP